MKILLLCVIGNFLAIALLHAQVTQINANKSLSVQTQLNSSTAIFTSDIDESLWVTDGTLAGTFQLSDTITLTNGGELLNGKFIFSGSSTNLGAEIFITDGTISGTKIIKDIYPGSTGSAPDADMAILNGFVYFTAATPNEGRELWRTDGTPGNTTLVKDIVPGPTGGIGIDNSHLTAIGNYLFFDANTDTAGNELWKSDGTAANTFQLKNISPGPLSSNPDNFYPFNNLVLFTATDPTHGEEIWKTDGTSDGTVLLKDIYPGPDSSTYIPINYFGNITESSVFSSFHAFNNQLFFMANDGVHGSAIWVTDGVNTSFFKVIQTDTSFVNPILLSDAINLPGKFIFSSSNLKDRFELWQSDGTPAGTTLFKSFPANTNVHVPLIYLNYSFNLATQTISYPLFNGNFFFSANDANGNELWISDGTIAGTRMVKDINPGPADGIVAPSYLYTTSGMYFAATDGTHGNELWKTDGTDGGTSMVADIFPGTGNSNPELSIICNNKIIFSATDGVPDALTNDLWVVGGNFTVLPVQLLDFTVTPKINDALLEWSTAQEINSKNFIVQSSDDATHWRDLGTVQAAGKSDVKQNYSFVDVGVMNSGRSIVYYRLESVDVDGKSTVSKIISLKINGNNQWDVQLFSNPVHGSVNVLLTGITGRAELSINDLNGKVLYKKQIQSQNGQFSIPVNLNAGMYIFVVKTNDERKAIQFIKE